VKTRSASIAVRLLLLLALPCLPAQAPMQPFAIDHFQREGSKADLTFLLDAPAGKHGFIRDVGGHLATDAGRIRFWGVNITGWVKGSCVSSRTLA
jgi:hypothetical protein